MFFFSLWDHPKQPNPWGLAKLDLRLALLLGYPDSCANAVSVGPLSSSNARFWAPPLDEELAKSCCSLMSSGSPSLHGPFLFATLMGLKLFFFHTCISLLIDWAFCRSGSLQTMVLNPESLTFFWISFFVNVRSCPHFRVMRAFVKTCELIIFKNTWCFLVTLCFK